MQNKSIDNAVAWLLLLGGPFVTMFVVMNGVTDPVNITKMLAMTTMAFGIMGLVLTQWRDLQAKEIRTTLVVSALVGIALIASVLFSGAPLPQLLFGNYGRNTGLITYMSLLFIFFSASLMRKENFSRNLLRALMVAGVLNAFYGVLQLTENDPLHWNNTYKTILGTLGNPDFISAFLGITAVVSFAWVFAKLSNWKLRILSALYIILALVEIRKSHAIQGFAVMAIGVGVVGLFLFRSWFNSKVATIIYSLLVAGAGFIGILGAFQKGPLSHYIYKASISFRGEYWAGAINTAKDHPIFGVGLDTYGDWYRAERRPSALLRPGPDVIVNTAHNVYLDMLASGGLFLFITYLLLLALSIRAIIRVAARNRSYDATFVALTAGWIGFQAQSAVSINQIGLAIWGWLLGGALVSYEICTRANPVLTPQIESKRNKRKASAVAYSLPPSAIIFGAVGGFVGLFLALPPYMADNHWYNALTAKDPGLVVKSALASPMDSNRLANAANTLTENKFNDQALIVARAAVKFNPRNFESWAVLSYIPTLPPTEKADAIKHLQELDPLNPNLKNLK